MRLALNWKILGIAGLIPLLAGPPRAPGLTRPAEAAMSLSRYVGLYENNVETPLLPMILSAQSRIQIEIYEMQDHDVLNALRAALSRGVRIEVVQEPAPMSSRCLLFSPAAAGDDADCQNGKQFIQEVLSHGGAYVPFNKNQLCGTATFAGQYCFEHGKLLIVDEQIALVSTGNFNADNLCSADQNPANCDRDYTVVTNDAQTLQTLEWIFEHDLAGQPYDLSPVLSPVMRQKMTVSPVASQPLLQFISSAKVSIEVQNQYLDEPNLNDALVAAAQRGVKVSVTVSSPCSFGAPNAEDQARLNAQFTMFQRAGIDTRFFTGNLLVNGRRGYLHAKTVVVDGIAAWVGSNNGSSTSFFRNREFGLFFNFPQWVANLSAQMESDHSSPQGSESWQDGLTCRFDPPPMAGNGG